MELFTTSPACTGCGLCVKACPASLVRQREPGGPVMPLPGRAAHCIRCGHCVLACPTGAFDHAFLPTADFEPLDRAALPDLTSLRRLLMARRSCRMFRPGALSHAILESVIEAVRHAPTGHTAREVGYVVVDGPERMDRVRQAMLEWIATEVAAEGERSAKLHLAGAAKAVAKGKDVLFRGAPHVVVVHAPAEGVTPRTDAIIAATWLELAAAAAGLGACWCGYLMFALEAYPPMADLLGLPGGNQGYAAILLGRPALTPRLVPPRPMPQLNYF